MAARQTLNIWFFQVALINLLVEPSVSDSQFSCQAWNAPEPIDHGDLPMPMQGTDLAVVLAQLVNGANSDGQSACRVKALGGELCGNLWICESLPGQFVETGHQPLVIACIRLPIDRRHPLRHRKVATDPDNFDFDAVSREPRSNDATNE